MSADSIPIQSDSDVSLIHLTHKLLPIITLITSR